jgi:putative endonuclease
MFYVYIIFSKSLQKYYVGSTSDLKKRIVRHNTKGTSFTSIGKPWDLIVSFECYSRVEAVRLELKIKKRGIGRYLIDNNLL